MIGTRPSVTARVLDPERAAAVVAGGRGCRSEGVGERKRKRKGKLRPEMRASPLTADDGRYFMPVPVSLSPLKGELGQSLCHSAPPGHHSSRRPVLPFPALSWKRSEDKAAGTLSDERREQLSRSASHSFAWHWRSCTRCGRTGPGSRVRGIPAQHPSPGTTSGEGRVRETSCLLRQQSAGLTVSE